MAPGRLLCGGASHRSGDAQSLVRPGTAPFGTGYDVTYSSIAHMGYVLVALEVSSRFGLSAASFYLVAYFVMILGAFSVVTALSKADRDAEQLDDYRGLFWSRPALALVFTAMLLSLAGIPLTAGFIGKFFYIVAAGAASEAWTLIIIPVITSTIGLFYYLRLIAVLFRQPFATDEVSEPVPRRAPAVSVGLAVSTMLLIWFGVYPAPLLHVIQSAIGNLI